jgi:hypothetical protein
MEPITLPIQRRATIDFRITDVDCERRFVTLPRDGNITIGVTDYETVHLWRRQEFGASDHSRVGVLLVTGRVDDGPRAVQVFSPDATIPNAAVVPLLEALGFSPANSVWRVVPQEDCTDAMREQLKTAIGVARSEYQRSKAIDAVLEKALAP